MSDSGTPSSPRGPIEWMAGHPVASNLLMMMLIVGGIVFAGRVKREVFPEVSLDLVTVSVAYPGASPEEVEEGVVLAVEEAIRGVDGVDDIRAVAGEGEARVVAELEDDFDADQVLVDIQNEIARITSFPQDSERPLIAIATNRREVVSIIIHGSEDLHSLKNAAEEARDALMADERITLVEVTDLPPPEIHVEVPQALARRHGLTHGEIARRIAFAAIDVPGGEIETPSGDVLIRTKERRDRGIDFAEIELIAEADGSVVKVGDVAQVIDGFRDTDQRALFNGELAVRLDVFRSAEESPLVVAEAVREYVQRVTQDSPAGLTYSLWNDRSEIYRDRISLLSSNALLGVILVIIILGLFLNLQVAFWVTLGIPISFLSAFMAMSLFDVSLNMISLFAFILALGIVVDDAIVAGEAIFEKQKAGMGPLEAAAAGIREVGTPIVFAVLTTITAFVPLLFIPGVSGKFFDNIPLVVIPILTVSLVEAFFILPRHLAHERRIPAFLAPIERFQQRFSNGLERFVDARYRPWLALALRQRALVLSGSLAVLILCFGLLTGGRLPFRFFPAVEGDVVTASVAMPFGTSSEVTMDVMTELMAALEAELQDTGMTDHKGMYAVLGRGSAIAGGVISDPVSVGGHLASIAIFLPPAGKRRVSAERLAEGWRARVGELVGVDTLSFEYRGVGQSGKPVAIELRHGDVATLQRAASELAASLATMRGVVDVDDGVALGKEEIALTLLPSGRALGITEQDLGRQVRDAFFGAEAVRQQRGREELRVYVRRPESERTSVHDLESFVLRTPRGGEVPLSYAADLQVGRSDTRIERVNGRRAIQVSADVETDKTSANTAMAHVLETIIPELERRYPTLSHQLAGEQKEQAESIGALRDGMLLALLGMYALIAIAFRSYLQPVIILIAIPFGLVGAIGGHLLLGYGLSLISLLGLVALTGVVVNDSLVLVAAVNEQLGQGSTIREALVQGGARRFRPIVLTSLTTFFGLAPIILETSLQARFLVPMAISLGFGVLFVTVITLLIVPCVYLVLDDLKRLLGTWRDRWLSLRTEVGGSNVHPARHKDE